ncbi:DUF2955 domain-containing protein [Dickeya solani]|uniref:DUF2955 domain-containing protein n=1 Tax=Dickeya solani TaxID=1089444 RepID=A0AAX4EXI8_9GAMM|nr:DUF2955 domain-containing protein [Dickeya solani]WOA52073.1 DUF2955 domain-containing protein [Dickeya solani]
MSTEIRPKSSVGDKHTRFFSGLFLLMHGHPLSSNDVQQCLRIATAGTIGFAICKTFNWNYGVFFTASPILLVGLVPVFNGHIARQFILAAMINSVEVGIIAGFFSHMPVVMTILAFILFFFRFRLISNGPLLLFGISGVVSISIMFHLASYPGTDLHDMLMSNIVSTWLAVIIAVFVHYVFPDTELRAIPYRAEKSHERSLHESLLGAFLATLSFLVFQVLNLHDSLSAQMASIFVILPLHYRAIITAARWRILGVIIGCVFGLLIQLLLYTNFHILFFILPLLWIGFMLGAKMHVTEKVGSGVGFNVMSTMAILFGQYLQPGQDLVYNDLYRISSVIVSLLITLAAVYVIHTLLNLFPATRFRPD